MTTTVPTPTNARTNARTAAPHLPGRAARRAGWVATAAVSAFLLFDVVIHLLNIPVVQEATVRLGYDPGFGPVMGGIELAFLLLYLYRRTAVFGALLLTAYLGGACASQIQVAAPLFSTLLFPVYTAVVVWGGLWLRDAQVRALVPLRRA